MSRLSDQQLANLRMAAEAAVAVEMKTGLPAEIPTVQFCIETQWGRYGFNNNFFGLKADTSDKLAGTRILKKTQEFFTQKELDYFKSMGDGRVVTGPILVNGKQQSVNGRLGWWVLDWFKTFASMEDCFMFHSRLFTDPTRPYYKAFQAYKIDKNLDKLVESLSRYATAQNYVSTLKEFIQYSEVKAALIAARMEYGREDND